MRVLCIGLKVGAGLESICYSVMDALKKHDGVVCDYVDIYAENPKMAKFSSENYYKLVKHIPRTVAFGQSVAYKIALRSKRKHFFINKDVSEMKKELVKYIKRYSPDIIYTPLNTTAMALDELIEEGVRIKYVFQMPDFVVSWYSQQLKHCSKIFSSCKEVTSILTEKGANPDIIKTYGVPIAEKFYSDVSVNEVVKKLGANSDKFILVSNGGAGFGDNCKLVRYLYDKIKDYNLIIVNGNNEKSKKEIDAFIKRNNINNVINLGFVTNMPGLMKASQIMVGKSGSSSICEASTCKVKFIVYDNKLFPEVKNILFLKKRDAAIVVKSYKQIVKAISAYLNNDENSRKKHANFSALCTGNPSAEVARDIIGLI